MEDLERELLLISKGDELAFKNSEIDVKIRADGQILD